MSATACRIASAVMLWYYSIHRGCSESFGFALHLLAKKRYLHGAIKRERVTLEQ